MPSVVKYDRQAVYRGDTISSWSVNITKDGQPAPLFSAKLELKNSIGKLIYDWPVVVSGSTVTMETIPSSISSTFPIGTLEFSLEVTLVGGRTVTWLIGTQKILSKRVR